MLMKVMGIFSIIVLATIFMTCCGAKGYISDNPLEELSEMLIEEGLDLPEGSLDLSPFSPEKK